ncbi:hypothetical protein B0H13DRAFT_1890377 [Mycena leptocephala]|nr:hypothetical protein B0H13DRAFT_1890377 [Mycena leptocephala]
MPAKFLSLSVIFSALFVSQLVVAIPNVDCSLVRCAAPPQCAFDQPAFLSGQSPRADGTNPAGECCSTCVPCVLLVPHWLRYLATAARLAPLLQIVPLFSVSPVSARSNQAIAALLADWERSEIERANKGAHKIWSV